MRPFDSQPIELQRFGIAAGMVTARRVKARGGLQNWPISCGRKPLFHCLRNGGPQHGAAPQPGLAVGASGWPTPPALAGWRPMPCPASWRWPLGWPGAPEAPATARPRPLDHLGPGARLGAARGR